MLALMGRTNKVPWGAPSAGQGDCGVSIGRSIRAPHAARHPHALVAPPMEQPQLRLRRRHEREPDGQRGGGGRGGREAGSQLALVRILTLEGGRFVMLGPLPVQTGSLSLLKHGRIRLRTVEKRVLLPAAQTPFERQEAFPSSVCHTQPVTDKPRRTRTEMGPSWSDGPDT
jgi:hypothetical protein